MLKHLIDLLSNQIVGGGLVLMVTGAIMAVLRRLPEDIWRVIKRQFVVELTIYDSEPIFEWVTIWLDKQPYSRKARAVNLSTITQQHDMMPDGSGPSPEAAKVLFTPSAGKHFFRFRNRFVWFERDVSGGQPADGAKASRRKTESYHIRILGRDQSIAHELVHEALAAAHESSSRACAYISTYGYWRRLIAYRSRPLDTVDLPRGVKEELLSDIRRFLAAKQDYHRKGIPYHRGYLFSGPPGTGKTSLVSALADELKLNLYVLNLVGPGMNDERLLDLIMSVRQKSVVIFEDIDAVVPSREAKPKKSDSDSPEDAQGVTLSGLLNCLDGIISPDGCLFFLTTNYPEKLDSALVRPGRVDHRVEFGYIDDFQAASMIKRLAPELSKDKKLSLGIDLIADDATPAEAQHKILAATAGGR